MKRGVLFAFLTVISSTAVAKEVDNPLLKTQILNTFQKQYPVLTTNNILLETVQRPELTTQFPGIPFYNLTLGVSTPEKRMLVSILNNEVLNLSYDFNKLLVIQKLKPTTDNITDLAYSFAISTDPDALPYIELDRSSINIKKNGQTIESIEFITYSKLGGIKKKWQFVIKNNQFTEVYVTVIEKRIGDYIIPDDDYSSFNASIGVPKVYFLQSYEASPDGAKAPWTIGISPYYVIIRDNKVATSDSARTAVISVEGLAPNEICSLRVSSLDSIGVAGNPGNLLKTVDTADGSGDFDYFWKPGGDAGQASSLIKIEVQRAGVWQPMPNYAAYGGPPALLDKKSASDPFNVDPDFALNVFYCTGFGNYTGSSPDSFAQAVWDAVVESYDVQVKTWGFRRPYDANNVYEIYINDATNALSNCDDNLAFTGTNRIIGIRCNSFGDHNYSSVRARVNGAVAHEFSHGIQYSYVRNYGLIWGSEGKWVREGQARAIPSIMYQAEEFANNSHFYPEDADNFLRNNLNLSLRKQSYRYCMYWRFLYENYRAGTTVQKIEVFKNSLIETAKQDSLGRNAVVGGELAMNTALSTSGGIYTNFDNSIDSFAVAGALRTQYYNPNNLYDRPNITGDIDNDGITSTFNGRSVEKTDSIPQPFGMDYMVFNFSEYGEYINLKFFANPDSNPVKPKFHVRGFLRNDIDGTERFDLNTTSDEIDTVLEKEPGDTLWIIVTRVDSNEAVTSNEYRVSLSYPGELSLISPIGGEHWLTETSHNITWTGGGAENVRITLYKDSSYYKTIVDSTPNNGLYAWNIDTSIPPDSHYRISIASREQIFIGDYTEDWISIHKPVELTSPNGGETWYFGQTANITWQPSGGGGEVNIELSTDGGLNYELEIPFVADNGSYSWVVPHIETDKARIRISHCQCWDNSDTGDADFEIAYTSATVWTVTNTYTGEYADTLPGTLPWVAERLHDNQGAPDLVVFGVSGTFHGGYSYAGYRSVCLYDGDRIDASTAPGGLHSVILDSMGISVYGSDVGISGLVINGGDQVGSGIYVSGSGLLEKISIYKNVVSNAGYGIFVTNARDVNIWDNYVGTDVTGMVRAGNSVKGIAIWGESERVANVYISHNVVCGNGDDGIFCTADDADSIFISRNFVGLNAAGTDTISNANCGIVKSFVNLPQGDTVSRCVRITNNYVAGNKNGGIYVGHMSVRTSDCEISGNFIGTDTSGTKALGNGWGSSSTSYGYGIEVFNWNKPVIENNLICANKQGGIIINSGGGPNISTDSILIRDNIIGLNVTGDSALGNGYGIRASMRHSTIKNNVIGGNTKEGIYICNASGIPGDSNLIINNYIGTDITGTKQRLNYAYTDVGIYTEGNRLGTLDGSGKNVIANGVSLYGDSNMIYGNYIGLDKNGESQLAGNYSSGVYMVDAHYNKISGNVICGFSQYPSAVAAGVTLSGCSRNIVSFNSIGINMLGQAVPNKHGVCLSPGYAAYVGNIITDNVISGNNKSGIYVSNIDSLLVTNNYIGTNFNGDSALHNGHFAVACSLADFVQTYDNVIAGGMYFYNGGGHRVEGNFIGTDVNASGGIGKTATDGIYMQGTDNDTIMYNSIAGNGRDGIRLNDCENNVITANTIGEKGILIKSAGKLAKKSTTLGIASNPIIGKKTASPLLASAKSALPNNGFGISLESGKKNVIGTSETSYNIISGNDSSGIRIFDSDSNTVKYNTIGDSMTGNSGNGVLITGDAQYNTVEHNNIRNNGASGIAVTGVNSDYNCLWFNSIYANSGLGIDLGADGVTANDAGDGDTGPNEGLNFPVIDSMKEIGASVFDIYGTAPPRAHIQLYWVGRNLDASGHGEGYTLLGWNTADVSGNFVIPTITVLPGQLVSAIAIDSFKNTSEFSDTVVVSEGGKLPDIGVLSVLDMDSVTVDTYRDSSLWVHNYGDANLYVYGIVSADSDSIFRVISPSLLPVIIPPLDSMELKIRFSPDDSIDFYDTLFVYSNDPDEGVLSIDLTGIGYNGVGTEIIEQVPTVFSMSQNKPNPFAGRTVIRYGLPVKSVVSLGIYNVSGQCVKILASGDKKPGYYEASLDAKELPAGIYFAKFSAGKFKDTKKLVLMR